MQARRATVLPFLLAALCAAPGLACSSDEPAPAAQPAQEAAAPDTADTPADSARHDVAEAPVLVDTTNDDRSVAQRLRDATTAARIRKALVEVAELRPFDFEPVVEGGRVLLRGEVQTAAQRDRAADVARRVGGVRDVVNAVAATAAPDPAESTPPPASPTPTQAPPQQPARPEPAPPPMQPAPKQEAAPGETHHTVRSGESLWTISQRYGVTIDEIKRLNGLRSNNLTPGQRIRVK